MLIVRWNRVLASSNRSAGPYFSRSFPSGGNRRIMDEMPNVVGLPIPQRGLASVRRPSPSSRRAAPHEIERPEGARHATTAHEKGPVHAVLKPSRPFWRRGVLLAQRAPRRARGAGPNHLQPFRGHAGLRPLHACGRGAHERGGRPADVAVLPARPARAQAGGVRLLCPPLWRGGHHAQHGGVVQRHAGGRGAPGPRPAQLRRHDPRARPVLPRVRGRRQDSPTPSSPITRSTPSTAFCPMWRVSTRPSPIAPST